MSKNAESVSKFNKVLRDTYYSIYHNLRFSDKLKEESCIGFTQENSMKFQVQSVYLIYARLLVYAILTFVVATTRRNSTRSLLTSAKLLTGYLVVGIYKRTRQEALAALLLYLYKLHVVHATTIITCPYVHALSSCPITHPHMFSLRPLYFLHVP